MFLFHKGLNIKTMFSFPFLNCKITDKPEALAQPAQSIKPRRNTIMQPKSVDMQL